jgi:hypothetical protein
MVEFKSGAMVMVSGIGKRKRQHFIHAECAVGILSDLTEIGQK